MTKLLNLLRKTSQIGSESKASKRKKPNFHPFIEAENRNSEQTHIIIGLPVASFSDPYRFEAYMLNAILGRNDFAPLSTYSRKTWLGLFYL